jgi:hypothetical protein
VGSFRRSVSSGRTPGFSVVLNLLHSTGCPMFISGRSLPVAPAAESLVNFSLITSLSFKSYVEVLARTSLPSPLALPVRALTWLRLARDPAHTSSVVKTLGVGFFVVLQLLQSKMKLSVVFISGAHL